MKKLPDWLVVLAAISLGIGLLVRLVQTFSGTVRPAFLDPVFYWRGAMAMIAIAIFFVLVQIRDK
jgi:hypothetical protein